MELAPTFKLICKKNFNKEMVLTTLRVKERFRQYPLSHGSKVGCNSYFREHLFRFFPELCCKLLFFSSHCRGHGPPDPSKKMKRTTEGCVSFCHLYFCRIISGFHHQRMKQTSVTAHEYIAQQSAAVYDPMHPAVSLFLFREKFIGGL
jgi:hypothetical protein